MLSARPTESGVAAKGQTRVEIKTNANASQKKARRHEKMLFRTRWIMLVSFPDTETPMTPKSYVDTQRQTTHNPIPSRS